jgi:hypothetical protein
VNPRGTTRLEFLGRSVAVGAAAALPGLVTPASARADAVPPSAARGLGPYPPSSLLHGAHWDFAGLLRFAHGSDLWPVTWAADDNLYTGWGDGGGFGGTNVEGRASLGFSRMNENPVQLGRYRSRGGVNVWGGRDAENPAQFIGKPLAMLSVGGVLYCWIWDQSGAYPADQVLIASTDRGAHWNRVSDFVLPEAGFIPTALLNFGRDYAGARDGYVYLYGGSATYDHLTLARVPKDRLAQRDAYEWFAGETIGRTVLTAWSREIEDRTPVFRDSNGVNGAAVSFNAGIGRYLLTTQHSRVAAVEGFGLFEAPAPWGPWATVSYESDWGGLSSLATEESLGYVLPTKWMSADGLTVWCIFSSTGILDSLNIVKGTLVPR